MSKSKYAEVLRKAAIPLSEIDEARIECLRMEADGQEEIRFSWWKNGKFMRGALDLAEEDLLRLFKSAIEEQVFSPGFRQSLRDLL